MKQLQIKDFLKYKYLSNLQANKTNTKALYVLAKTNYDKNEYNYDLYSTDGKRRNRVMGLGKNPSVIFESDNTILRPVEKTKKEKKLKEEMHSIYYRYNLDSKEEEKAYTFNFPVTILEVLSDNLLLVQTNLTDQELKLKDLKGDERKEKLKNLKQAENFEDIEQLPFYSDGGGFITKKKRKLFIYNIKEESFLLVNDENITVQAYLLNEDTTHIFYTGTVIQDKVSLTNKVFVYNYKTNERKVLYNKDDFSFRSLWVLDNKLVLYGSDMKDYGLNQNGSFYVLENNDLTLLAELETSLGNSVGSDCRLGGSKTSFVHNDRLYFISTVVDHNEVYSLDISGNVNKEYIARGSIDGLIYLNGLFISIMMYQQRLQELYSLDFLNNKQRKLTSYNNKALSGYYVSKPKVLNIKLETHNLKGYVMLPKDYDPNKKYPAILDIHGGPKTVYGKVFFHEMQVWANLGYFVFFTNPRGSDGKGNEFSDIRGKYGTIDYEDLMLFTDRVLKKYPQIDEEKLFVTGGSYGGFMTNWIVGQTNRFKAAATQRSISNWISFYSTSDIGFYFAKDQTGGHPLKDLEKLWEQSPLKYAMNITTPLLFIHSDKDYRCPIEQAMQLYGILKDNGIPTKLVWFKDETHNLSRGGRPQGRVKRLEEITNWFDKYL